MDDFANCKYILSEPTNNYRR